MKTEIVVALIGAAAIVISTILSILLPGPPEWLHPTQASTTNPTETPAPDAQYPIRISDKDLAGNFIEMRLVPAGEFAMGSDDGENDEVPVHKVHLGAFYIDAFEVTNKLYKACADAGACWPPKNTSSYSRRNYYSNSDFDDFPVVNVNWQMAMSYCAWRGGAQLPTEAQWEKAARGGLKNKPYPWGSNVPVCEPGAENGARFSNKAECKATDTQMVGSYTPNGFGIYDMAGNVWEWTSSLQWPYPYISTDDRENPQSAGMRVLRGGSFRNAEYLQRVSYRHKGNPQLMVNLVGFRCVRPPP